MLNEIHCGDTNLIKQTRFTSFQAQFNKLSTQFICSCGSAYCCHVTWGPSCLREAYWSVLTRLYMIRNASVAQSVVAVEAHWDYCYFTTVWSAARSRVWFDLIQTLSIWCHIEPKADTGTCMFHHYNASDIRRIQNWDSDLSLFSSTGTLHHLFSKLPRRKVWPCWPHLLLSVPGLEKLPERHIWC